MARFVALQRIDQGLDEIREWRNSVNSQTSTHLWQFLALKRSGVNTSTWTRHSEADDFKFCDELLRVRSGREPYYDPLIERFRIESHPHSNLATARKNTFKNRWKAGEVDPQDPDLWRFSPNYLTVLQEQICTKGGNITRIPVHSLCAWLFRAEEFLDTVDLTFIRDKFRKDFNITPQEYATLFQDTTLHGKTEVASTFFSSQRSSELDVLRLVEKKAKTMPSKTSAKPQAPMARERAVQAGRVSPEEIATLLAEGRGQVVLYGPPGTGKTFVAKAAISQVLSVPLADLETHLVDPSSLATVASRPEIKKNGAWSLVQFHPSYTYEDFVRGLVGSVGTSGTPVFQVRDGIFAALCQLAASVDGFVVLVIDEINRGDLAKVLGELVYALEYRDQAVALQYATSAGSLLKVPSNLLIIATMNTADRSIAHLDYAIRRRFDFVHCPTDRQVVALFHESGELKERALALFDAVASAVGHHPDYAVGHAFFLHREAEDLARAFCFQVLPLLAEYHAEGLLDASSITVAGWPDGAVPLTADSPFVLAERLATWLGEGHAD